MCWTSPTGLVGSLEVDNGVDAGVAVAWADAVEGVVVSTTIGSQTAQEVGAADSDRVVAVTCADRGCEREVTVGDVDSVVARTGGHIHAHGGDIVDHRIVIIIAGQDEQPLEVAAAERDIIITQARANTRDVAIHVAAVDGDLVVAIVGGNQQVLRNRGVAKVNCVAIASSGDADVTAYAERIAAYAVDPVAQGGGEVPFQESGRPKGRINVHRIVTGPGADTCGAPDEEVFQTDGVGAAAEVDAQVAKDGQALEVGVDQVVAEHDGVIAIAQVDENGLAGAKCEDLSCGRTIDGRAIALDSDSVGRDVPEGEAVVARIAYDVEVASGEVRLNVAGSCTYWADVRRGASFERFDAQQGTMLVHGPETSSMR